MSQEISVLGESDRGGSLGVFARRLAPTYQGAGPVFVGLLFAVALLCTAFPHLHGRQVYPDLVPGYLAYHGGDKSQDNKAFGLLVGLVVVLPLGIAALARFVAPRGRHSDVGRAVQQLLLLSLIPAAWRLAVDAAQPSPRVPRFSAVSVFPLAAILGLGLLARYRRALRPAHVLTVGGACVLIVFLSAFVGSAVGVTCVRLVPPTYRLLNANPRTLPNLAVALSMVALPAMMLASPSADVFQARVLRWLQGLQYPLLLLFFHMVPPPFVDPQHRFNETYPTLLVVTLSACIAVAGWTLWRRFGTDAPDHLSAIHRHPLARALAPAAVAAVLLFVYCSVPPWPSVSTDDFHWGEQALPWPQLVEFHRIPYVDFVPIHGLMAYIPGAFDSLFFEGTAATYPKAYTLFNGLAVVTLALSTCLVVGPLGALVLLGGVLPDRDRAYFYIPAFFVLAAPQVVRNPVRLLIVWLCVTFLLLGYNPTQGPAFAVATLPVGLWAGWRAFRTRRAALAGVVAVVAGLAILTLAIPLARHICFAFVAFVADNAYTNVVAHDIPWVDGKTHHEIGFGPNLTQFLWELTRSFWFVLGAICAALFWKRATARPPGPGRPLDPHRATLLILTGTLPLYLIIWSPWINGRLMPGVMNYPGDVSQTCLTWLVPVLVLLAVSRRRLVTALLALAAVSGFFYPKNPTHADPAEVNAKAVWARVVNDDMPVIDGPALGMPRVGRVVPSPVFFYLDPIKKFLDGYLRKGETYLDLTNRTALYYYLDLPYPVRYVPFVAANSRLQAGILQQLDAHPVPAVMISPNIMIDMVSVGFRDYFIFRRYATRYSLATDPGFKYAFLVDPARGAALHPPASPVGSAAHTAGVDAHCYFMEDLNQLPASFGHSWDTLGPMFTHVVNLNPAYPSFTHDLTVAKGGGLIPTGDHPYLEFPLPPQAAVGQHADFLRLRFQYDPTAGPHAPPDSDPPDSDPQLAVRWIARSTGQYSRPFTLAAPAGDLLLPLGAYPRWLLANDLMTIRFDLLQPERARSFRITQLEFLHLNDPPPPH